MKKETSALTEALEKASRETQESLVHNFIGYARSPKPIEQMLDNMFVGRPAGNYDRLLDFSTAVTRGLFFVPSSDLLEELADRKP